MPHVQDGLDAITIHIWVHSSLFFKLFFFVSFLFFETAYLVPVTWTHVQLSAKITTNIMKVDALEKKKKKKIVENYKLSSFTKTKTPKIRWITMEWIQSSKTELNVIMFWIGMRNSAYQKFCTFTISQNDEIVE